MSNKLKRALEAEIIDLPQEDWWRLKNPQELLDRSAEEYRRGWWRRLLWRIIASPVVAIVLTALITFSICWLTLRVSNGDRLAGTITTPANGTPVGREADVTGTAHNLPTGYQLCLFVEREGLVWPKEAKFTVSGTDWTARVFDLGTEPGSFRLSLWCISPSGQRTIDQWWTSCRQTQQYPGLIGVSGSIWLNSVRLTSEDVPKRD